MFNVKATIPRGVPADSALEMPLMIEGLPPGFKFKTPGVKFKRPGFKYKFNTPGVKLFKRPKIQGGVPRLVSWSKLHPGKIGPAVMVQNPAYRWPSIIKPIMAMRPGGGLPRPAMPSFPISRAAPSTRLVTPMVHKLGKVGRVLTGKLVQTSKSKLPVQMTQSRWLSPYTLSGAMQEMSERVDPGTDMISQGTVLKNSAPFLGMIMVRKNQLLGPARNFPIRSMPIVAKQRIMQKLGIIPSPNLPFMRTTDEPGYVTQVETIGFESAPVGSVGQGERGGSHAYRAANGFLRSPLAR